LEELDRWIVQSPDSLEAVLWKAYALDRLKLSEKAERLLFLAQSNPRLAWDEDLMACLGFVLENRGQKGPAQEIYRRVARRANRLGNRRLEASVLARLAPLVRQAGSEWEARGLESRAKELSRAGQNEI